MVINKLLNHYNQRFCPLILLCSRLHWARLATWCGRKKLSNPLLAFNLSPVRPRLSGYNGVSCWLPGHGRGRAWYFPNKTELQQCQCPGKTVLLITLLVNYCPHTYYLCQFLWGELIAFGQEWVYCGMLYNHTSSRAWLLILFRYWYHPINYHGKL